MGCSRRFLIIKISVGFKTGGDSHFYCLYGNLEMVQIEFEIRANKFAELLKNGICVGG
jgi:hypothetical protein